jgi:hypothetical protein
MPRIHLGAHEEAGLGHLGQAHVKTTERLLLTKQRPLHGPRKAIRGGIMSAGHGRRDRVRHGARRRCRAYPLVEELDVRTFCLPGSLPEDP